MSDVCDPLWDESEQFYLFLLFLGFKLSGVAGIRMHEVWGRKMGDDFQEWIVVTMCETERFAYGCLRGDWMSKLSGFRTTSGSSNSKVM